MSTPDRFTGAGSPAVRSMSVGVADQIKVSCRSEGDFSVSDICARYFGGGGHKNAAGGDFHGTMDEAVEAFHKVLDDCRQQNI